MGSRRPESRASGHADPWRATSEGVCCRCGRLSWATCRCRRLADVSNIDQVFLNLLVNAAHAIAEEVKGAGGRGRMGVRTVYEKATRR